MNIMRPCDRRKGLDTRWGELIMGFLTAGYGWHAMSRPAEFVMHSQFQTLVTLQGNPFFWGLFMTIVGISASCAYVPLIHMAMFRAVIHALMFLIWASVMILFLDYRQPGIPLVNGGVFVMASLVVIINIIYHRRHEAGPLCREG